MTVPVLRASYDAGISTSMTIPTATLTGYSLSFQKGACTATVTGPGGTINVTGARLHLGLALLPPEAAVEHAERGARATAPLFFSLRVKPDSPPGLFS